MGQDFEMGDRAAIIQAGLAHIDRLAIDGAIGHYELQPKKRFRRLRWIGTLILYLASVGAGEGLIFAIWAQLNGGN